MTSKYETRIVIAGGLGNQLFQIAAALFVSGGKPVLIDMHSANPRFQKDGAPEIDFTDTRISIRYSDSSDSNWLIRKIVGFSIRQSGKGLNIPVHVALEFIASIGFSMASLQFRRVWINRGIGFDPRIESAKPGSILIGYFQTHCWVARPGVLDGIRQLIDASAPQSLKDNSTKEEFRIAVHVRLGDYLSESSFGIPNLSYYRESLGLVLASQTKFLITLFSDDPKKALRWIPTQMIEHLEIFDDKGLISLETLVCMSRSDSLIIANSTFSWWAATLSTANPAYIVAPTPWFANAASPIKIIPDNWNLKDADYPPQIKFEA